MDARKSGRLRDRAVVAGALKRETCGSWLAETMPILYSGCFVRNRDRSACLQDLMGKIPRRHFGVTKLAPELRRDQVRAVVEEHGQDRFLW
jgi:hypothetical protein